MEHDFSFLDYNAVTSGTTIKFSNEAKNVNTKEKSDDGNYAFKETPQLGLVSDTLAGVSLQDQEISSTESSDDTEHSEDSSDESSAEGQSETEALDEDGVSLPKGKLEFEDVEDLDEYGFEYTANRELPEYACKFVLI